MAAKTAEIKNKPIYNLLSAAKIADLFVTVHILIKKGKTPDIKIQINK
jgi:phage-related protein